MLQRDRRPSDRNVLESEFLHLLRRIQVAAVQNHWLEEQVPHPEKIRAAVRVPLCVNDKRVRTLEGLIVVISILDGIAENALGLPRSY